MILNKEFARLFAAKSFAALVAAIVITLAVNLYCWAVFQPGDYSVQPRGSNILIDLLLLFLIVDVLVIGYSLAISKLDDMTPFIRTMARFALVIPLIVGGYLLQLTRFGIARIDATNEAIELVAVLNVDRYQISELDEVLYSPGDWGDQIVFRWYSQVHASHVLYPHDRIAKNSAMRFLNDLNSLGVSHKVEPSCAILNDRD